MTQRVKPGTRVSINFDDPAHPWCDAFESAYTDKPLTSDTECVYYGDPTDALEVACKSDAVISYLPQLWNASIVVPPLGAFVTTGGVMQCIIKLGTPIGAPDMASIAAATSPLPDPPVPEQYKIAGFVKTGTPLLKASKK